MRDHLDFRMQRIKQMGVVVHTTFIEKDDFDHVRRRLTRRDLVGMNDHALGPHSDGPSLVVYFGDAQSDAGVLLVGRKVASHRSIKHKTPVTW